MTMQKLFKAKLDRRRLLGNLGMMGAGAVITACGGGAIGGQPEPEPEPGPTPSPNYDAAILNFALNLEYLEAAFYLAAVGRLSELQGVGGDAAIVLPDGFDGTTPIAFDTPEVASYADEIASDELAHVLFLRGALEAAGAPVAERPVLDFVNAFAGAAQAAFGLDAETAAAFDPFANELFFLHGAFIFEDVGVTAYNGAAPFITDRGTVLQKAAGILAVEAYHSGEVRTLLYQRRDTETPFGVPVSAVVQGISDLRGAVGGGKDQGIVNGDGSANIVPTDDDAIAFARTPREVANIVYLGPDTAAGGFFPEGITVPAGLEDDFGFLLNL